MSETRVPFKKFTEGDFICEIRRLNRAITKLSYERDDLQQENQQLKDRINKAIEYIGSREMYNDNFDTETNKLLEMLKGDKE